MKTFTIPLALACFCLASPATAERILTEEDFRAKVVGKSMTSADGATFKIHANGKLTGSVGSKKFRGVWNWQSGYFCRNGKMAGKEIGSDCQVVEVDGDTVTNIRNQGKGKKAVFTLD